MKSPYAARVSGSQFRIGWRVGPYFAYRALGLACVWQRVIVLEYHHILEGSLQRLYPVLTPLNTDGHCIAIHLTQLVLWVPFHWTCAEVYASLK